MEKEINGPLKAVVSSVNMKKIASYAVVVLGMISVVACQNQGFNRTKSGLLYKIIPSGSGAKARPGQFLKLSFIQKIRDSVMYTSADAIPVYPPVDSPRANYSATEIFSLLRKGDSAVVVILADSIRTRSHQPLPPFIKRKDKIFILFKVLDILPNQGVVMEDREKAMNQVRAIRAKELDDYLATHHITGQKTAKGTYVVIDSAGTGAAVDSGKQALVMYTGRLLPSGKIFETNMSGPNNKPIPVVIGRRAVIPGWDEGLRLFKKGGKGTLYIPAAQAYDVQNGPGNKPFENLEFEIQVVDVTDAPKETPRPNMMIPRKGLVNPPKPAVQAPHK
jgi:FKBP-type peptidyl-prolyl cis-trans isomerase FkpA